MTKPLVVLAHPLLPVVRHELSGQFRVVLAETPQKLRNSLPKARALVTSLLNPVTDDLLSLAPDLKVVATFAVGVNNIDLQACKRRGIKVVNTPKVL